MTAKAYCSITLHVLLSWPCLCSVFSLFQNPNEETAHILLLLLRTLLASWEREKRGPVVDNVIFLPIGLNGTWPSRVNGVALYNLHVGRSSLEVAENSLNIIYFSDLSEVTSLNFNLLKLENKANNPCL